MSSLISPHNKSTKVLWAIGYISRYNLFVSPPDYKELLNILLNFMLANWVSIAYTKLMAHEKYYRYKLYFDIIY